MVVHELNLSVLGSDGKPGKPFALRGTTEAPEIGDRLSLNGVWHLVVDVAAASPCAPGAAPVTWIHLRKLNVSPAQTTEPGIPEPRRGVAGSGRREEPRRPSASERVFVVHVDERDRRAWMQVVTPALPVLPMTLPPAAAAQRLLQEAMRATAPPSPGPPTASSSAATLSVLPVLPPTRPPGPWLAPASSSPWLSAATRGVGRLVLPLLLLVALAAFAFTATLALGKYRRRHTQPPPPAAAILSR